MRKKESGKTSWREVFVCQGGVAKKLTTNAKGLKSKEGEEVSESPVQAEKWVISS